MHLFNLEKEIENARKTVHVDSYPMSIGELVNLYKEGDLNIQPEFQRIFRWNDWQRSQFIESILLGIPIPSIFVAQQHDGRWDVVDGLQRISTILQFLGLLKDEFGNPIAPLELQKTKYLPSLKGKVCVDENLPNPEEHLEDERYLSRLIHLNIQRAFKREKIDLKIIKKESNEDAKLELFQRLNTGGTKLSDQEVRNCILLMINKKAFDWVLELSKNPDFRATLSITQRKEDESYSNELILKYLILRHFDKKELDENEDLNAYLDQGTTRIFNNNFDFNSELEIFSKTFRLLNEALGDDSFRKYNQSTEKHKGGFSNPIYECLTIAVSNYIANNHTFNEQTLIQLIKTQSKLIPTNEKFIFIERPGTRSLSRLDEMRKLGMELFSNE